MRYPQRECKVRHQLNQYHINQTLPVFYWPAAPSLAAVNPFLRNPLATDAMWFALLAFPLWLVALGATIGFGRLMVSNYTIEDFSTNHQTIKR